MDSTNKENTTKEVYTPVISNSFGGSKVDLDYTPEPNLSGVSLTAPKEDTGLSSLMTNDNPTSLTDKEISSKVDKYSFALGKSFSKDTIHDLVSTDNEETLRHLAASNKDIEDEQDRQEALGSLLSSGEPVDSVMYTRAKALAALKPKNNPAQILEEAYAKRFVESLPSLGPKDNAFNRLTKNIADATVEDKKKEWINTAADAYLTIEEQGKRLKVYQENAKDALERAEKLYASESTFGKVVDFGKSMVPFLDYYNIAVDTPGLEAISLLPGTSIAAWVDKLYDQPPAVQKEWLNTAVDTIGQYNPALAIKVAEAATSYTSTDKFLDNLTGALDLPGPGEIKAVVGGLASLGTMAIRKGFKKGSITNAIKEGVESESKNLTDEEFSKYLGNIGPKVEKAITQAYTEGNLPNRNINKVLDRMSKTVSNAIKETLEKNSDNTEVLMKALNAMGQKVSEALADIPEVAVWDKRSPIRVAPPGVEESTLFPIETAGIPGVRTSAALRNVEATNIKNDIQQAIYTEANRLEEEALRKFRALNIKKTISTTKGSDELSEVLQSYKSAIRADLSPNTDPVDFQAAMGDINSAAVSASQKPTEAQRGFPVPLSSIPTYLNVEATPGASQGLAGAQASRFKDFVTQRADKYRKIIDESVPRVNRLPEETLQMALNRAKEDFENTYNQAINSVVQNARKVVEETPPNEAKLMSQIEKKFGKVDWTPDGKELPPTRSAIATPDTPIVSSGFTRLYRMESVSNKVGKVAPWIAESEEYKKTIESTGRWFTDDLEEAKWYSREHPQGRIVYVDVPTAEAEKFRVSNLPKGESAKGFSARQEKEFFISRELADKKKPFFSSEDKLSAQIEAKLGKIPGPTEAETTSPAPFPQKMTTEVRFIPPEKTPENIAKVEYSISKPNGELFSGEYWNLDMDKWARWMGIPEGTYGAQRQGNGWKMVITQPLDETKPYIREHLIDSPKNKTPVDTLLSPLRRGGGRVSEFTANNRIAYNMSQEKTLEILKPLYDPLLSLDKDSKNALNRVMREESQRIHPDNGLAGYFYEDFSELSEAFQRLNGRSITPREIEAYNSARTINDLELSLRRDSYWKELVRLGLKKIDLSYSKHAEGIGKVFGKTNFEGKVIDELPLQAKDSNARAIVAFYDEGSEPTFSTLALMDDGDRRLWLKGKQEEGYKIIQTGNPVSKPGKDVFGEDDNVNFIITKNFEVKDLNPTELIREREGWHQIYPYQHWVKQPVIRKVVGEDGKVHHFYDGEVTLFGFHTRAEAKKYAKAMDEARQIAFEGKAGNLERHLAENLPYSEKHFRELFEDNEVSKAYFSKTEPFFDLGDGQISIDVPKSKEILSTRYSNLYDNIRSPWNLMNQVDKKFVGHRDELLHTVREGRGTQGNPVFTLATADKLDPLSSMSMGISNMIRNQGLIDLRIQHAESWLQEFKKLLAPESEQALYGDLLNTIFNPPYIPNIKNIDRPNWRRAENSRMALMELMNLETPFQMSMDTTRTQILDQIYERMGQKWSNESATSKLATTRHPLSFFRGLVYHTKVGFLNPIPAIQNVMQIANAVAISPKHGVAGAIFGQVGYWTRLNNKAPIVDAMADLAAKASGGSYKKEWFKEGLESMNRSGFFSMVGGHALTDHLNDPKLVRGSFGKVLDAGSVLFKESEKVLRTSAWMTSYLEWRSANPTKSLTSIDLNSIMSRATMYAGRMTRDEKARWQSGEVLSTFTQFWSYQARLMEMIWEKGHGRGDSLTVSERLRLLALNTTMYGIPIGGLGTAIGGFVNPYEHIKNKLTEWGVDTDNTIISLLMNGVLGHFTKQIFGVNVSPVLGPTGRDLSERLDSDFAWFKFATSPWSTIKNTPIYRETQMMLNGELHPKALVSDLWDIAQNVSTLNKITKVWLVLKYQKAFTRSGQEAMEVETLPGIISAITGQPVDALEEQYSQKNVLKMSNEVNRDILAQAKKDYRNSLLTDDPTLKAHYMARVRLLIGGLHGKDAATKAFHEVLQSDKSIYETNRMNWSKFTGKPTPEYTKELKKYFKNVEEEQ